MDGEQLKGNDQMQKLFYSLPGSIIPRICMIYIWVAHNAVPASTNQPFQCQRQACCVSDQLLSCASGNVKARAQKACLGRTVTHSCSPPPTPSSDSSLLRRSKLLPRASSSCPRSSWILSSSTWRVCSCSELSG